VKPRASAAKARIALRRTSASDVALNATLIGLVGLTALGFFLVDAKGLNAGKATAKLLSDLGKMFMHPVAAHFSLPEALGAIVVTLGLAILTTLLGAVLAIIAGPLAAKNLSPAWLAGTLKSFVAFIRAVPTVLWVLIFAIGAGLGSVAAVVGMTFHSFAYLLKAYSESFEEVGSEAIEALKASGANWAQIVCQAVIPNSASALLSWTFIRFEINFANAVAMGAAAGAGGIGYDLFMASGFYFNIGEVGFIAYLILAVAILLEAAAMRLRARARVQR
jgi:phosphonate transport system permease protein